MLLTSLQPYTHVYTTATDPHIFDHLKALASDAAPLHLTTFVLDVNKLMRDYHGEQKDVWVYPKNKPKHRLGIKLSGSREIRTLSSYCFTGGLR